MKKTSCRTQSGEALTSLLMSVFKMNGALLAIGDGLVDDLGLTSARWQVLGAISQGDASVARIAAKMGLARQGVQRIANRLHKDGLVQTRPNPDHARAKLYSLSPGGEEVMREVARRQCAWANATSESLGLERMEEAVKLLSEAARLIDNQCAEEFK